MPILEPTISPVLWMLLLQEALCGPQNAAPLSLVGGAARNTSRRGCPEPKCEQCGEKRSELGEERCPELRDRGGWEGAVGMGAPTCSQAGLPAFQQYEQEADPGPQHPHHSSGVVALSIS